VRTTLQFGQEHSDDSTSDAVTQKGLTVSVASIDAINDDHAILSSRTASVHHDGHEKRAPCRSANGDYGFVITAQAIRGGALAETSTATA
jgi:hypothetical protein